MTTLTTVAPLAERDVAELVANMAPEVPYPFPDLYRSYVALTTLAGRTPATQHALGQSLRRRGLIPGRFQNRRTWMVP